MATDYFLIELVTFIVTSITFFILGLYEDEWWRGEILNFFSAIFSYTTSVLIYTTLEPYALVASIGFSIFGSFSLFMFTARLWEAYAPRFRERGRLTE